MHPSLVRFPLRLGGVVAALWLCSFGGGRAAPPNPADAAPPLTVQVTETVNLHAGPGLSHAIRGQARPGAALTAQARSADDAWLAVVDPGASPRAVWIDADRTDIGPRRYDLPWAGPPAVCTRSPDVRAALRAAWAAQNRERACAEATWADLAVLTALPPSADDRLWLWASHDLAGLTGLRAARVVVTDAYAAAGGRLSGLARLERLDLHACCAGRPWPDHFLVGATRLQDLTVEGDDLRALPDTFLAHDLPLQHLSLHARRLAALPDAFLADTPQLQSLDLILASVSDLPDAFLADTPQLQSLNLGLAVSDLPDAFLADTPQLQSLNLGLAVSDLPDAFLADIPQLHTVTLYADHLADLPDAFLANAPQLQQLSLHARRLAALPDAFLTNAPQLRTVALPDADRLADLPDAFLANAPQLRTVTLRADRLADLPDAFLANAPQLRTVTLRADRLADLPDAFLANAPQLRTVTLRADRLADLPDAFLANAPQLRTVTLHAYHNLTALPDAFLANAPQLRTVTLHTDRLADLPGTFLAHAPQLQSLALFQAGTLWPVRPRTDDACLSELSLSVNFWPAHFLQAHAPCLQQLTLRLVGRRHGPWPAAPLPDLPQLQELTLKLDTPAWPLGLVAHAPRLRTLNLDLATADWPSLPRDFLASTPQLQTLTLELPRSVTRLPAHTLVEAPQLTQLWLQASELYELPRGFLAHAPRLHSLEMYATVYELPVGFLAHAPQLETLVLPAVKIGAIPAGFLARADRLQRLDLSLAVSGDASLPDGFLANVPVLQRLDLDLYADADGFAGLPDRFLAHAPQLATFNLGGDLTTLPDRFLTHAPRLRALNWYLSELTAIGDRVLAHAPALVTFALDAPRLATVGEAFLARADRLQTLTLLTAAPAPLRLGARFLARAPQVHTVRIGATEAPDAQTDLAAVALAAPAAFLADLPRLRTVELRTPLRDPPPPGFLRGAALHDLRLRVRIAADAQGARRLPARVQAAHWRLELTCDSAYPAAWLAPLAAPPPAALTVAPCHDEGSRYGRHAPVPPRVPAAALRAFLAGAPAATRLQLANYAQLAPADYARLPVSTLGFALDRRTFTGWVRAADAPRSFDGRSVTPDRALPVQAAPHADAPVLVSLEPGRPYDDYPILAQTDAPERWLRIPYAQAAAELAPTLAVPALEALYLEFALHAPETDVAPFAAALAAPAFLLDLYRDEPLAPLLRAPPAPIRHLGVRAPLGARAQHRWDLTRRLDGELAAALPDLDFACLHLVLPALDTPLPAQLRAAARRHGLALRLVAGFAPDRLSALDRTDALGRDAAAYFQQQHLPWAAAHACPRSLLLIDASTPSTYPRVSYLPPDLLDRPGALQRVRIVFDPRQCPECRTDH